MWIEHISQRFEERTVTLLICLPSISCTSYLHTDVEDQSGCTIKLVSEVLAPRAESLSIFAGACTVARNRTTFYRYFGSFQKNSTASWLFPLEIVCFGITTVAVDIVLQALNGFFM